MTFKTIKFQALYTVDEVPNHLVIGADVFATAVKNFQLSERDITLAVEDRIAVLRNYVPGGSGKIKDLSIILIIYVKMFLINLICLLAFNRSWWCNKI